MFMGVDNGLDGAVVVLNEHRKVVHAERMPTFGDRRQLDRRRLLAELRAFSGCVAWLEYAQAMPRQGAVSAFRYGTSYGATAMALDAVGISFEVVKPQAWQRAVGIHLPNGWGGSKVRRRAELKRRAIAHCRRALPALDLMPGRLRNPHDGIADAACMALGCMAAHPPTLFGG